VADRAAGPHVVIVGGGFGGLYCARRLGRAAVRVTLVDRRNFHLFQPLLYQVATASLSPGDIASPIRRILRKQENTEVWMGEATAIDVADRKVRLTDGEISYDYLVLATGAAHAYFGRDDWVPFAPGLKTLEDATEIRRRFLAAFEAAEREADPEARHTRLSFVIVGAGPTGVELAGAMIEIARRVMPRDFRFIDTTSTRILLLEGADRVLPGYPEELSRKAHEHLIELGVEVRTGALVTEITEDAVCIGEERIAAGNVFWAAGVAASKLGAALGAETDRPGRVKVLEDCTIPGHPEVFVIGDLASIECDGKPVPGVAQAAMQMGTHAANAIRADLAGKPRKPFRYNDRGSMATIGRAKAVAEVGRFKLSGFPAWALWVLIHISYLIGFRNRIVVMIQWAWAYLTHNRGIRLITGDDGVLEIHHARGAGGESGGQAAAAPGRSRRRRG
jgi:NADH:ubiquinone reductase (H+-translocating)